MKHLRKLSILLLCCLLLSGCLSRKTDAPLPDAQDGSADAPLVTVPEQTPPAAPEPEPPAPPAPPEPTVSHIVFAGDIIGHMTILYDASGGKTEQFDFTNMYADVTGQLKGADYAVANLESPLGGGPYSGYPHFNAPDALAGGAVEAGIDLFSTANNHTRDSGVKAILRTLDALDELGVSHVGTYRSQEERDENHGVLVADVGGVSVAFLCYTYGLNGYSIPSDQHYLVNLFNLDYTTTLSTPDYALLESDFAYARSLDADLIAVLIHWGSEYQNKPNGYQTRMAEFLVSQGADIVIGNHPHVLQPYTTVKATGYDGAEREGFVAYSLGNFISNQPELEQKTTAVLDLELTRDNETQETIVSDVSYTPYYFYFLNGAPYGDKSKPWGAQRLLLDTHKAMAAYESGERSVVTDAVYEQLRLSLAHCHKILGEEGDSYLR